MDSFITQSVAAITGDTASGAVEIAEKSADLMLRVIQDDQRSAPNGLRERLLGVGWALIDAHPTMAPLINLVNGLLWRLDLPAEQTDACQVISEVVTDFKRKLHIHEAAIAETALRLIPEDSQILTNGRSTTVRAALRHAMRAGRRFSVICAEGRPMCEGRTMAAELAASGIPVTLVIDALAISLVERSQLVLIGADHLGDHGLVNKVGTYGIALAASVTQVPVYALCGSEKFLPPGYSPPAQSPWGVDQVWAEAPTTVKITNFHFDTTPLHTLAGIVTEQGIQPTVGIEAWLAATRLHPALQGRSLVLGRS